MAFFVGLAVVRAGPLLVAPLPSFSHPPLPVVIGIGERVETLRPRKFRAPAVPGR